MYIANRICISSYGLDYNNTPIEIGLLNRAIKWDKYGLSWYVASNDDLAKQLSQNKLG